MMFRMALLAIVSAILFAACPATTWAEPVKEMPSPTAIFLPSGTYIQFEILDPINSKRSKPGEHFRIRTTAPVSRNGTIFIPAGAMGEGEVIHAARARAAGKAGELILAARFVEYGGQKIALRGFRFAQVGTSRTDEAVVVGLVAVPVVLFIAGSDIDVPVGTRGEAKLAADFPLQGG
jgi:hypothetical protein